MHDQIMNPARLPKDDPVYMPPKIVTGDKAKNVAAYVALVAAAGGKDTGRLAEAVKSPSSNKPVAAENGVLDMPADPNGQLAYVSKQATAPAGQLEIDSKNDANIPHDIAIEGNGVNEKGEEVTSGGDVQDLGRPEARHLHVLLHAPRPPRGRHGGRAHRQVTVALVAGATRGAGRGIAVGLGEAGATVYVTGRTTRERRSEYDRPETIEETAERVTAAGGTGIAVPTDHLEPAQVAELVARIDAEQGRLDVLVNDIWGGEQLMEWDTPIWEHDLQAGLRLLRLAVDTHLITSHHALPLLLREPGGLLVEVTDGTREYNATRYRLSVFYDLAKEAVNRMAWSQAQELGPRGATALAITPGWMRSEMMLEHYGVREENWRDGLRGGAALLHLGVAAVRGPGGRGAGRRCRSRPLERRVDVERRAGAGVRLHRRRRHPSGCVALHRRAPGARAPGGRHGLSLGATSPACPPGP